MMKLAILLFVGVIAKYAYGDEPERIVGGKSAIHGKFPHQISLQWYKYHICGGSIISPTHIVTAAHCVDDPNDYPNLSVVTGAIWVEQESLEDGERHNIKCIKVHKGYTGLQRDGWKDDIAVIILEKPIQFNENQRPIPLATKDRAIATKRGIISGWGKTDANSEDTSPNLKWAEVGILSTDGCLAAHPKRKYGAFTNEKHICTLETRGIGACQGDSGGPLVIDGELCGVTSWVAPCAKGIADVFTSVYHYLDFIKECQRSDICG